MSVLLSVAAARQSPDAAAAQAAPVGAGAECPAQEGSGKTTRPGAAKPAATLPDVLLRVGEKTKRRDPSKLFVHH